MWKEVINTSRGNTRVSSKKPEDVYEISFIPSTPALESSLAHRSKTICFHVSARSVPLSVAIGWMDWVSTGHQHNNDCVRPVSLRNKDRCCLSCVIRWSYVRGKNVSVDLANILIFFYVCESVSSCHSQRNYFYDVVKRLQTLILLYVFYKMISYLQIKIQLVLK